jgi:putative ABC transport system permease protein
MDGIIQDIRYALRQWRKQPNFTVFAILVMALGIGATTAMFSVIHAVLLKPLQYRNPARIVLLSQRITPVRFDEMKAASRSFSELGAFAGNTEQMALTGTGIPEVLSGTRVSGNFLQILGVNPLLGRSFLEEEDKTGAAPVAMISEKLWQQRFHGDPQVVGKTIVLSETPHTIVGVLPNGFQFPFPGLDVWVTRPAETAMIVGASRRLSPTLKVFGRLQPKVTLEQANAELSVLKRQYAAAHPGMLDGKLDAPESLLPLKDDIVSDVRSKLWMLFGAVGLVLLIVCANIGSLLLARASSRAREFAVRAAIGAGRGRIIRQLLIESVLLASVGGALGLGLAGAVLSAIRGTTFVDLPRSGEIRIDAVVFAFAAGLSFVTGVLFGLAPSLVSSMPDLAGIMKGSDGVLGGSQSKKRIYFGARDLLVAGQAAVSVMLLIGTTLLIQSLAHVYRVDPGFQPAHLLTMHIALSPKRYDTEDKRNSFYDQLLERVESLPGVRYAAVSLTLPLQPSAGIPVQLAAGLPMKLNERPISIIQLISPAYFRAMEIPLKRGREFTAHDNSQSPPVVIINQSLARRFWPAYPNGPDPVGQYMLVGSNHPPKEIVGVSADVHEEGKDQDPGFEIYVPNAQVPSPAVALVLRTAGDPKLLVGAVQKQVLAIDSEQPVSDVTTMDEVVEDSEGQLRLMMKLLAGFAGIATLLATIGLYGVISYSVLQRTKEIGIRQALGAQRGDVLSLFIRQGFGLSVAGIVVGIAAGLALTRVLKDMLFGVSATDPATFAGVSILFVLVALLASYIPARRAAKVDPMVALRYE